MKFLTDTTDNKGILYAGSCGDLKGKLLPLSYISTADYWAKYVGNIPNNNLRVVDKYDSTNYTLTPTKTSPGANLQIERVDVNYGTNIYDAACWQIALGVYGRAKSEDNYFNLANNQTQLLTLGYDGNADSPSANANRATTRGDGTFKYNGAEIKDPKNSYFYRMVTRNWLSEDPFINTSYLSHVSAENLPHNNPAYARGKITWMDWKPITGENAWAFLIGPLQLERLKAAKDRQKYVPFSSPAVQNAVNSLTAFASMQSPIGALYYACEGTLGNQGDQRVDPYEVSTENNASVLAGLLILQQTLQEEKENQPSYKADIEKALDNIGVMINGGTTIRGYKTEGLLAFFRTYAWNWNQMGFVQGGLANKPHHSHWVPSNGPRAVDAQTWVVAVLGQPLIDSWFGFGSAKDIWRCTTFWGGYHGPDGKLWGVGYSNQDGNGVNHDNKAGINSADGQLGLSTYCAA